MQSISQSQLSFMFWCVQGVWVWVTLLPTLILNTERRDAALGSRDYLGYGLWLVGFMFEVVADMQKSIFRANPENDVSRMKYQIIFVTKIFAGQVHLLRTVVSVSSSKLLWWDTSLVWTLLVSINCLQRWQQQWLFEVDEFITSGYQYLSVGSPIFIYLLLTRVSGKRWTERIIILYNLLILSHVRSSSVGEVWSQEMGSPGGIQEISWRCSCSGPFHQNMNSIYSKTQQVTLDWFRAIIILIIVSHSQCCVILSLGINTLLSWCLQI